MRLVLVSDSFIPKGPWELLWFVQAHYQGYVHICISPLPFLFKAPTFPNHVYLTKYHTCLVVKKNVKKFRII